MTAWLRRRLSWLGARAAALALLALIGAGYVLPSLHWALVAHDVCLEHGELVHAATDAEPAARGGNPALRASALDVHEHEHCSVPALPGSGAMPAEPGSVRSVPAWAWAAPAGGERHPHVDVALLSYAPKRAPPARA